MLVAGGIAVCTLTYKFNESERIFPALAVISGYVRCRTARRTADR
jgi:hypothetical protein